MGSTAEVNKTFRIAVHADRPIARYFACIRTVCSASGDTFNDFALVRLVCKQRKCFCSTHLGANEWLVRLDNCTHALGDRCKIIVAKGFVIGKFKVVVEAIFNGGANGEFGARKVLQHCLSQHVGS